MATLIFHSPTRELTPVPPSMDPPVHAAELNHRNNYGPLSSPNPISLRIRARLSLARAREPVAAAAASSSSSEEPEPQRRRAPPPIGRPLGERERERDRSSPIGRRLRALAAHWSVLAAAAARLLLPSSPPLLLLLFLFLSLFILIGVAAVSLLDPDWRCGQSGSCWILIGS
ncbi:hypothetical protein DAI22_03g301350 [Oryza sativa Japonica Group]|nr:hypothetical protein DAI22_03g301350 [Oryza sativa Japonica Group]